MKTILITGCSSGFGLATARHFLDQGWRVVATMRSPRDVDLPAGDRLQMLQLDVMDPASIRRAVEAAGPVDVLVNNAGVGLLNALEGTSMDLVRDTFETNVFGTVAMMQAVLPQFRDRLRGVIVNVSSSVTLMPLHLLSVYTASKAAVNALSETVALELEPFGIRVHVVLPGRSPATSFGQTARARNPSGIPDAYADIAAKVFAGWQQQAGPVTHAADVVAAIWRAATDPAAPLRLPAGADAVALAV